MVPTDDRGVSPVIGTVLMLAIVVIAGAAIGVFVFGLADSPNDPTPNIYRYTDELVSDGGSDDQIVRITHKGGETLEISESTIDVLLSVDGTTCQGKTRLTDPTLTTIDSSHFEGDDILDSNGLGGQFGTGSDEAWQSGEEIEVRISNSKCSLATGDEVNFKLVHDPSKSIVIDTDLTVES
jgi:flagellin-like protein